MMQTPLHKFSSPAALEEKLLVEIISQLEKSIAARGHANLAVSGGSTPKALFKALSEQDIAWEKVNISLVDERIIDPSLSDSNEYLVNKYLLQGFACKATFISLNPGSNIGSDEELSSLEERLIKNNLLPFDVLILGMGNDGHTASLFPCADEISTAMDRNNKKTLIRMTPKSAPYKRISFTLAALLKSHKIFLHLVGDEKLKVLQQASVENRELKMPISAFLHDQDLDMTIYWAQQ